MNELSGRVNIVVAHRLEAQPLIDFFELTPDDSPASLTIYKNDTGINLIMCGIGTQAASLATADLGEYQSRTTESVAAWLNFGIAGHKTAAIGSGLVANRITDQRSGKTVYPSMLLGTRASSPVLTVEEPEVNYAKDLAYEMEAYGFWSAASIIAGLDLIQVYKLISDNPTNPAHEIDLAAISELVSKHMGQVSQFIAELQALSAEYNGVHQLPSEYALLSDRFRLSVTQHLQLKRLCQRFRALDMENLLVEFANSMPSSGRHLLDAMESRLETQLQNK